MRKQVKYPSLYLSVSSIHPHQLKKKDKKRNRFCRLPVSRLNNMLENRRREKKARKREKQTVFGQNKGMKRMISDRDVLDA